ncbi:MAG: ABC transporter permease [Bacteroidota bacterium]
MISHFLRIFFRALKKRATYSLINIFGLVLGMTACLLIASYVIYEKSYDQFHVKKDNIYRVRHDRYTNHELTRQFAAGPMGFGDDLKRNFPEVIRFTRLNRGTPQSSIILSNGDVRFKETRVFYASEDFFKIFSFDLIVGVDSLALKDPWTMVVSESTAKKYFSDANPIGKTLKGNSKEEYTITGVFRDTPGNTHMKVDALFSFPSLHKIIGPEWTRDAMESWGWEGNYTYVELQPGTDMAAFDTKVKKYVDRETEKFSKTYNEQMAFVFQPLTSLHLNSDCKDEMEAGNSEDLVNFLSLVAIFILIISWINYVNLSTARSIERAREVGIRKVLGTRKSSIVLQFIFESFVMKLIALVLTIVTVFSVMPYFSMFVGQELSISILTDPATWMWIAIAFIFGVIGAGIYPALVMSGFKPALVLKGNFKSSQKGTNLRRGLVTFQFMASIILVTVTLAMFWQLKYMQRAPLGMDKDRVMVVVGPNAYDEARRIDINKELMASMSSWTFVESVAISTDVPGHSVRWSTVGRIDGKQEDEGTHLRSIQCDENYLPTYGLELIAGRNFMPAKSEEWQKAMVNESAMKSLGFEDPLKILGKKVFIWDHNLEVVGVLKDYHGETLKRAVDKLVFVCDREANDYLSIKFGKDADLGTLISTARDAFDAAYPANSFQYFFMDDYFERQYIAENAFGRITAGFAILATLISCLGLFGLSSYMIIQRTKEIGIRKILGATARQIVLLMSKEYLGIIVIANVISWPLSYLLIREWLNGFAYRVDPGLLLFLIPGVTALVIAFFTIAGQSVKAAVENPVNSLRSE